MGIGCGVFGRIAIVGIAYSVKRPTHKGFSGFC
jgi:hypothetical protein